MSKKVKNSGVQISTRGYAGSGPGGSNPDWTAWRDVAEDEVIRCLALNPAQRDVAEIRVRLNPVVREAWNHNAVMRQLRAAHDNMTAEELLTEHPGVEY